MLGKCNIDVNATGKIKHFGTLVEGATALWLAAGQYNILNCRKSQLFRYYFQWKRPKNDISKLWVELFCSINK